MTFDCATVSCEGHGFVGLRITHSGEPGQEQVYSYTVRAEK